MCVPFILDISVLPRVTVYGEAESHYRSQIQQLRSMELARARGLVAPAGSASVGDASLDAGYVVGLATSDLKISEVGRLLPLHLSPSIHRKRTSIVHRSRVALARAVQLAARPSCVHHQNNKRCERLYPRQTPNVMRTRAALAARKGMSKCPVDAD
eukprot:6213133-Pleurochrysis_carterae.AAC.6